MKTFEKIIYYKLQMTLASPLCIGSGRNDETDRDVMVDASGRPFIPATSITGVLRSALDEEKAKEIFGFISGEKNNSEKSDSKIRIYDARQQDDGTYYITSRDCVKLENKVGVKGAKFDMQAVETGAEFVSYIELLDESFKDETEKLFSMVNEGVLRFGSKTTRGYGQVKLKVYKKEITTAEEWFTVGSVFGECVFEEKDSITLPKYTENTIKLKLDLECKGGISIRAYSTDVNAPDYETMGLHSVRDKNNNKTPVIPGTSWTGAFRSRFEEIAGKEKAQELFGFVEEKSGVAAKSKIYFSESKLEDGSYKELTRNSIDRFSAATKDSALYTERTYYYGKTTLEITLPADSDRKSIFALTACLADLHNGFLSVGGLTSVGRGMFTVTAVNGNEDIVKCLDAGSIDTDGFIKEVFGK